MPESDYIPKHRMDALIDAVIAITMTLLVLELRVPEDLAAGLLTALGEIEPKFISWVVSFFILALLWRGHMRVTRDVAHVDFRLFVIVVFWLLLASLIPFTSSLIGEHNELFSSHMAYGLNLIAIEMLMVLRDLYLRRHRELSPEAAVVGPSAHRLAPVTLSALVSMAVALGWPDYASLSYLLLLFLMPLSARLGRGDGTAA